MNVAKEKMSNRIVKVVVNAGIGRLSQQGNFDKILPEIKKELISITGQYPSERVAKQSIAGFKIRSGQVVGLITTLRGKRSSDFINKLVNIVLPRVRDFRGLSLKNLDNSGNLNIGVKEHNVFPEINMESSSINLGLEITIVTDAKTRDRAVTLYRQLGLPLRNS